MSFGDGQFYLRFRRSMKTCQRCGNSMLTTAAFLLATSMLPGWALASVLDGTGDRLRKALLAPALGLLLLYGINGALLVLGVWTPLVVWLCVLMVNAAAYRLINTRHEVLAKRSRWQLLEAAMHGEVSEETDAPSLSKRQKRSWRFKSVVPSRCSCWASSLLAPPYSAHFCNRCHLAWTGSGSPC